MQIDYLQEARNTKLYQTFAVGKESLFNLNPGVRRLASSQCSSSKEKIRNADEDKYLWVRVPFQSRPCGIVHSSGRQYKYETVFLMIMFISSGGVVPTGSTSPI